MHGQWCHPKQSYTFVSPLNKIDLEGYNTANNITVIEHHQCHLVMLTFWATIISPGKSWALLALKWSIFLTMIIHHLWMYKLCWLCKSCQVCRQWRVHISCFHSKRKRLFLNQLLCMCEWRWTPVIYKYTAISWEFQMSKENEIVRFYWISTETECLWKGQISRQKQAIWEQIENPSVSSDKPGQRSNAALQTIFFQMH